MNEWMKMSWGVIFIDLMITFKILDTFFHILYLKIPNTSFERGCAFKYKTHSLKQVLSIKKQHVFQEKENLNFLSLVANPTKSELSY